MDLLSPVIFAIAAPAVVFAGVSKGGFGSGASFAAASILALVLPPQAALGLLMPLLMLIDLTSLPAYWGKWSKRDTRVLILGAVPGVALGTVCLSVANPDAIRLLIGANALGFVLWQLAQQRGWLRIGQTQFGTPVGLAAGMGAGFASFVSHAGGPLAAVFLLGQGLGKTTYQATTVVVFCVVNVMKTVTYAWLGLLDAQYMPVYLALVPFALFGTWLGIRAHLWVSERWFFAVTYIALTLTGTKLIWDGLT